MDFGFAVTMDRNNCDYDEKKSADAVDLNGLKDTDSSGLKLFTKHPLEILEIMEIVMMHVGKKDLFKCREVCKVWDEAVVRIVTSEPGRRVYLFGGSDYIETRRFRIEPVTMNQDLNGLLSESGSPNLKLLLKNVLILPFIKPSEIPAEVQYMLGLFGKYVKNLQIEENDGLSFLSKCIGKNGYCPNVKVLKVESWNYEKSSVMLGQIGTLKLQKLTLTGEVLIILDWILKSSSDLNSLTFKYAYEKHESKTQDIVERLQNVPDVTKRLKKLRMEGEIFKNWEGLCNIEFSNKLKVVKLCEMYDPETLQPSKEITVRGLRKFLKLVSKSVESFHILPDQKMCYMDNLLDVSDLPFMPKLKETSVITWNDPSRNLDFLKKLPLLNFFELDHYVANLHEFLENYLDKRATMGTPGSLNYVPNMVHKHLQKIIQHYEKFDVYSPSTITMLNAVFPNLRDIEIELQLPKVAENWKEGQQMFFEKFFFAISEMKHLQELTISFINWKYNEFLGPVDLTQTFSHLKASTSLEYLVINGYDATNPNYTFLMQHLTALIGAPKIRHIHLYDFPTTGDNKETVNEFALNGITFNSWAQQLFMGLAGTIGVTNNYIKYDGA